VFTICTYWVGPTSPSVSGGRQLQLLPWAHGGPNGRQMPSKFWIGPEIGPVPFLCWTTGSFAFEGALGWSDSISLAFGMAVLTGSCGSELTAGDSPW
jgi:hypothetical protein